MLNFKKTRYVCGVFLTVLLVAGCDIEPTRQLTPAELEQRQINKASTNIVIIEHKGLRCAQYELYPGAGAGLSCDWANYVGN